MPEPITMGKEIVTIIRTLRYKTGVRGVGYLPDGSSVHTLEDNPIPAGAYFLRPDDTGKHRNWVIESTLNTRRIACGRKDVEIHAGNILADSAGCILPGMGTLATGIRTSRSAVLQMALALDRNIENPPTWFLNIEERF